jgi:hypothetical protein
MRLYDLENKRAVEFLLADFPKNIHEFSFVLGQTRLHYEDAAPVNLRAAGLMAELHDALKAQGYGGHPLEVFLVRTMFCLFADHTGIFERKNDFRFYLEQKTNEDGSDFGLHLNQIFAVLDTPADERQRNLDDDLSAFPYVDGRLFAERFDPPSFNAKARQIMLNCCEFDWSAVSPAIFGSMFQMVMDPKRRRNMGGHYTSEKIF